MPHRVVPRTRAFRSGSSVQLMNEPYLLRVYEKWKERQTQKKEEEENTKKERKEEGKHNRWHITCPVKQQAGPLFSRIDSAIMFVNLPPLVRGVG